jgi:legumain
MVDGKSINSCLGDLYSINWMEDSDIADVWTESLITQFQTVKRETTKSHETSFGDYSFDTEAIGEF